MRFITVTLTADDTPATIKSLAALTDKFRNVAHFMVYAEGGNEDDATNGCARIGGSDVDRVAAGGVKGIRLLPGLITPFPPAGATGTYSFERLYITGKTNDVFQIGYVTI